MKQVSELKPGDKIYDFGLIDVLWYEYVCVHPRGQGKYHILINASEEPFRIYGEKLQAILNKGLNSYEEAKLALADRLTERAEHLRKEPQALPF